MKLTKEEIWHISQIMKERGVGHCQFCKDLIEKFEKEGTVLGGKD